MAEGQGVFLPKGHCSKSWLSRSLPISVSASSSDSWLQMSLARG